jgi:hypothetical protein
MTSELPVSPTIQRAFALQRSEIGSAASGGDGCEPES